MDGWREGGRQGERGERGEREENGTKDGGFAILQDVDVGGCMQGRV